VNNSPGGAGGLPPPHALSPNIPPRLVDPARHSSSKNEATPPPQGGSEGTGGTARHSTPLGVGGGFTLQPNSQTAVFQ